MGCEKFITHFMLAGVLTWDDDDAMTGYSDSEKRKDCYYRICLICSSCDAPKVIFFKVTAVWGVGVLAQVCELKFLNTKVCMKFCVRFHEPY